VKVDLKKLVEGRDLDFSEEWRARSAELEVPGLIYEGPVRVSAVVSRQGGIVRAKTQVQAHLCLTCARCSRVFSRPEEISFDLSYPADLAEDVIFLDDDIRQEIILGYSSKILCRPDCRGLCPKCGADLNEEECNCH
jgi:uncharacterized protein